jgi:ubiquinol-cytochrome c reductase cytochrome b subunit
MKLYFSGWLLLFFTWFAAAPAAHAASRAQRQHGAEVFNTNGCLHCHTMGSLGGQKGPNLSDAGLKITPQAMRKQIVEGSKGMPAFRDVIEPKDLDDLIAYLRSCKTKSPK